MSTLCGHSVFVTDSADIATTTHDIVFTDSGSGLAFQPNLVLFFWGGGSSDVFLARGNSNQGRGWAVSATDRASAGVLNVDAVGTTIAHRAMLNDTVMFQIDSASNITLGRLDFSGFNVDGIRLITDEAFSASGVRVSMLGLGGDLDTAAIIEIVMADDACVTTPRDFTGFGFDPVFGMAMGYGDAALGVKDFESRSNLRVFRSAAQQGAWGGSSEDAVATSSTARYNRFGDIALIRCTDSGSVRVREDFNALITDGFRLNCLEDNDDRFFMMGLLGGSFHTEEFVTRTSTGDITLTPGFRVSGGFIMSSNAVESVDNDSDALPKKNSFCFGIFSGVLPSEQKCYYGFDENALATSQVTGGSRAAVYMNGDQAASPVIDESIEVSAIGATTITLNQSIAGATAHHCIAVLFGTREKARHRLSASGVLGLPQYTRYD